MPDWLRHRLLYLLPAQKQSIIRDAINEKLVESMDTENKDVPIVFSRYKFGFTKRCFL